MKANPTIDFQYPIIKVDFIFVDVSNPSKDSKHQEMNSIVVNLEDTSFKNSHHVNLKWYLFFYGRWFFIDKITLYT
jgi:hypothetical protein